MQDSLDLIRKINEGPAVLLIGQKYQSLTSGKDILLERIQKKFENSNSELESIANYDLLLNFKTTDYESASVWIENLCKDINGPLWLDVVSRVTWAAVYTSAVDTVIARAFLTEWRKIQPIYDDKFKISDPRNKLNLHLTYLYGCISQLDAEKRCPFSNLEKTKRKSTSNTLLRRLPEIITPKGVILIEALNNEKDWLSIEELYAVISRLGTEQAYIFSLDDNFSKNEFIQDLISSKKLVGMSGTLASFLAEAESSPNFKINIPEPDNYLGKWISVDGKRVKVPTEILNRISRTAIVITDNLFLHDQYFKEEDRYSDFRRFLSSSGLIPEWIGYAREFAFKRDYFDILLNNVRKAISSEENETPIILFGQASSGKTISLGLLAYTTSQKLKIPTLFIEKRYQKIDDVEVDNFCRWVEETLSTKVIIIWDGMTDIDNYYQFLSRLNARGRNIVLIGSSYNVPQKLIGVENFIDSPIELTLSEKQNFSAFLKKIDPILSNILSGLNDTNFLSMLYRYLPYTRNTIISGLKAEMDFFSREIRLTNVNAGKVGAIGEALIQAGIFDSTKNKIFEEYREIDGEEVNLSDKLIFLIIVPGEHGLNVPFELLLRTIGYEVLSSELFEVLNSVDLIKWIEDYQGNISLGARTAIEAKILSQFLGTKRGKVEYIKLLLKEVKSDSFDYYFESNLEIQFTIELLNNIGPNSQSPYNEYLYEITQILKELRESKQAYHPRLILKEASFLREVVKGNIDYLESKTEMLDRAEEIVREILDRLKGFKERIITAYLRIELATILGTKTIEFIEEDDIESALSNFQLVKDMNHTAFAINPDNYRALDVLTWTTKALIRKSVFTEEQKISAEADILHLFEMAESEGVSELYREDFYKRKVEIYELIGNEEVAEEAFEQLIQSGSTLGFYIRAKQLLGDHNSLGDVDESGIEKCKQVIGYLHENIEFISNDGRCLYLLLKVWWTVKTKSILFSKEKQAVSLSKEDWEFCIGIIEKLLTISDIYYSASILYLKGVSEFHLDRIKDSMLTFKTLDVESDFSSYGRKRIIKTFMASTPEGHAKQFSGEVRRSVSILKNEKIGELYVSELREYIPFVLTEFGKSSYQAGERIEKFFIGFNFRGPIAAPVKY